jgi:hypothetical protein
MRAGAILTGAKKSVAISRIGPSPRTCNDSFQRSLIVWPIIAVKSAISATSASTSGG